MELPLKKYYEILSAFNENVEDLCGYLSIIKQRLVILNPKVKKSKLKAFLNKQESKKKVQFKDLLKSIAEKQPKSQKTELMDPKGELTIKDDLEN